MTRLRSATLSAADYDGVGQTLRLQFGDGACYQYASISPALFAELLAAPSQGAFFNRFIRGKFLFCRLKDRLLI